MKICIGNESKSIKDWCKAYNITPGTVAYRRKRYGISTAEAIQGIGYVPYFTNRNKRPKSGHKVVLTVNEMSEISGVPETTLNHRFYVLGMCWKSAMMKPYNIEHGNKVKEGMKNEK